METTPPNASERAENPKMRVPKEKKELQDEDLPKELLLEGNPVPAWVW